MKTIRLDKLGRVVIPIQYRKNLGVVAGSKLNIEYSDGKVIITPAEEHCCVCGKELDHSLSIPLCNSCIEKVKGIEANS